MYKVIRIMDEMSILINCGYEQGVSKGTVFNVFSNEIEKITDPFTGQLLGEIRKFKAKVEATEVYDKMCICQNTKKSSFADIATSLNSPRRQPLNVDASQISGNFKSSDEEIQIGDDVEVID